MFDKMHFWPGLAMLRRMAGRSLRFHFCISSSILSILAGFSAHRQPLRDELLVLFSTFSKHLFKERLCLTEFFHPSGAVCVQIIISCFFWLHLPFIFSIYSICNVTKRSYLKIRKVFLHKAIDLTDWEAASFAVLQSHGNQTAEKKMYSIHSRVDEWGNLCRYLNL